jgi:hypothetical protein
MADRSLSYEEILARRAKRKAEELAVATRRPKIPNSAPEALVIMILQWQIDAIYAEWRARELEKAQARKIVLPPKGPPRRRGGRKNAVLEQLGIK